MPLGLTSTCATLTAVGCGCALVATIFHAVSFGTRRWIVSKSNSPFVSIGFHEACFDHCRDPYCPGHGSEQVEWTGCTWLFNWYFQSIWHWLMPSWFMTCRNLSIVNVPLIAVTFILLAITTAIAFKGRYTTESTGEKTAKCTQGLLLINAILLLAAAIINMVVMTMFYNQGFQRAWMPMPEKNAFGSSFWLEFVATILLTAAFVLCIFATITKTMWLYGDKDPRYSEDMILGRSSPGPSVGQSFATSPSALGDALKALEHRTV